MPDPLATLLEVLDLEALDPNIYRGQNEDPGRTRLFGGQVAAQALAAAGRTVESLPAHSLPAHSLHAYFLRAGDPKTPVLYKVDRIRDGRSFVTRRVVAVQHGEAIFNLSASFHRIESGYEHQSEMPDAPDPETLRTWEERVAAAWDSLPENSRQWMAQRRPIDLRHADSPSYLGGPPSDAGGLVWLRAAGTLPDDPFLHQCVWTYASDMSLLDNTIRAHGRSGPLGPVMMASLDHAIWFHRAFRADQWLLYVQDSPAAAHSRGFARASLYSRDGVLVSSAVQEGLIRPVGEPEDRSH